MDEAFLIVRDKGLSLRGLIESVLFQELDHLQEGTVELVFGLLLSLKCYWVKNKTNVAWSSVRNRF